MNVDEINEMVLRSGVALAATTGVTKDGITLPFCEAPPEGPGVNESMYSFDFTTAVDRPWARKGTPPHEFFNYGFSEHTFAAFARTKILTRGAQMAVAASGVHNTATAAVSRTPCGVVWPPTLLGPLHSQKDIATAPVLGAAPRPLPVPDAVVSSGILVDSTAGKGPDRGGGFRLLPKGAPKRERE